MVKTYLLERCFCQIQVQSNLNSFSWFGIKVELLRSFFLQIIFRLSRNPVRLNTKNYFFLLISIKYVQQLKPTGVRTVDMY